MLFGGYEHWMLRFWTLRKLDATLLDALIATRRGPPQGAGWCSIFDIDGQYLTHEFFIPCMVVGICILCIFSVMISVLIVLTGPYLIAKTGQALINDYDDLGSWSL